MRTSFSSAHSHDSQNKEGRIGSKYHDISIPYIYSKANVVHQFHWIFLSLCKNRVMCNYASNTSNYLMKKLHYNSLILTRDLLILEVNKWHININTNLPKIVSVTLCIGLNWSINMLASTAFSTSLDSTNQFSQIELTRKWVFELHTWPNFHFQKIFKEHFQATVL